MLQVSKTTFELTTPNRVYKFTDIVNESEYWVDKIHSAVKQRLEDSKRRSYEYY